MGEEGIDEPSTTANIGEKGSCPANDVLGLLVAESSESSQHCAVRPISPLAGVNRKVRHDDLSAVEQDRAGKSSLGGLGHCIQVFVGKKDDPNRDSPGGWAFACKVHQSSVPIGIGRCPLYDEMGSRVVVEVRVTRSINA